MHNFSPESKYTRRHVMLQLKSHGSLTISWADGRSLVFNIYDVIKLTIIASYPGCTLCSVCCDAQYASAPIGLEFNFLLLPIVDATTVKHRRG